jgi:hypothetical protein
MSKNLIGTNSNDFQGYTSTIQNDLKQSNAGQIRKTKSIPNLNAK